MLSKTFLKILCVSVIGGGAFVGNAPQSFAQDRLQDPGYGIHMQRLKKKREEKRNESGLVFSRGELNEWKFAQQSQTEQYDHRVKEVMAGRDDMELALSSLRVMYPRTYYYDPFGKYTIRKMTEFAYIADTSEDQIEVNEALVKYRDLLYKHLGNIDVIEYALTLSYANPIYGNKLRLKKVHDILRKLVSRTTKGMGERPETAYRIVTYGEESYLLSVLEVTVQKSEIYRVHNRFYNVHDVVDAEGNYDQLFFDVTWPIYLYEKTVALKDKETFAIPAR